MERYIIPNQEKLELIIPLEKIENDANFTALINKALILGLPNHNEMVDGVFSKVLRVNFIEDNLLRLFLTSGIVINQLNGGPLFYVEILKENLKPEFDNNNKLLSLDKTTYLIPVATYTNGSRVQETTYEEILLWSNAYGLDNMYSDPLTIEALKSKYIEDIL